MLGLTAEFGYLNIVQDITKNCKCDPEFGKNYAIRWSSKGGHLEVMKYLMILDSKCIKRTCRSCEIFDGRNGFKIWD